MMLKNKVLNCKWMLNKILFNKNKEDKNICKLF